MVYFCSFYERCDKQNLPLLVRITYRTVNIEVRVSILNPKPKTRGLAKLNIFLDDHVKFVKILKEKKSSFLITNVISILDQIFNSKNKLKRPFSIISNQTTTQDFYHVIRKLKHSTTLKFHILEDAYIMKWKIISNRG